MAQPDVGDVPKDLFHGSVQPMARSGLSRIPPDPRCYRALHWCRSRAFLQERRSILAMKMLTVDLTSGRRLCVGGVPLLMCRPVDDRGGADGLFQVHKPFRRWVSLARLEPAERSG